MTKRGRLAVASTAAMAAVLLAGCTGEGDPGADATATGDARSDNGAADAGIDANNPPEALSTHVVTSVDKPLTEAKVSLLSLRRNGQTATLLMSVTPTMAEGSKSEYVSLYSALGSLSPRLLDAPNLLRYAPLKADSEEVSTGTSGVNLYDGKPTYYYAVFPAPKGDKVDVQLGSGLPSFTGVTVQ